MPLIFSWYVWVSFSSTFDSLIRGGKKMIWSTLPTTPCSRLLAGRFIKIEISILWYCLLKTLLNKQHYITLKYGKVCGKRVIKFQRNNFQNMVLQRSCIQFFQCFVLHTSFFNTLNKFEHVVSHYLFTYFTFILQTCVSYWKILKLPIWNDIVFFCVDIAYCRVNIIIFKTLASCP